MPPEDKVYIMHACMDTPRVMLCEDNVFHGPTFAAQLEHAYGDFKAFLRAKKIPCSQKMFTPRLVAWKHQTLIRNWYCGNMHEPG